MWLHEALMGGQPDGPVEFDPDMAYRAWRCETCGVINEDIGCAAHSPERCRQCGRAPERGRPMRVTTVDHERKTITVSG